MSFWQENNLTEKITQILKEVPEYAPHHLGYPFLSAYQIAIEFSRRHPEIVAKTTYKVGGVGTGERNSLAQYLAQQLSRQIKSGRLPQIEGGFISNWHLHDISFDNQGEIIHSSLTGTSFTLSQFRYKGD
jgi:hypothetical protein